MIESTEKTSLKKYQLSGSFLMVKSHRRTFQADGGEDRRCFKELEGGTRGGGRKSGSSSWRALLAKVMSLDFIQWEDDMIRFEKVLLLARHYLLCVPKNSSDFFTHISGTLTGSSLQRQRRLFCTVNQVIASHVGSWDLVWPWGVCNAKSRGKGKKLCLRAIWALSPTTQPLNVLQGVIGQLDVRHRAEHWGRQSVRQTQPLPTTAPFPHQHCPDKRRPSCCPSHSPIHPGSPSSSFSLSGRGEAGERGEPRASFTPTPHLLYMALATRNHLRTAWHLEKITAPEGSKDKACYIPITFTQK